MHWDVDWKLAENLGTLGFVYSLEIFYILFEYFTVKIINNTERLQKIVPIILI